MYVFYVRGSVCAREWCVFVCVCCKSAVSVGMCVVARACVCARVCVCARARECECARVVCLCVLGARVCVCVR